LKIGVVTDCGWVQEKMDDDIDMIDDFVPTAAAMPTPPPSTSSSTTKLTTTTVLKGRKRFMADVVDMKALVAKGFEAEGLKLKCA